MRSASIALTLSLSLVILGSYKVHPAHACLNGTIMEEDEMVKNTRLAEKAIEKGAYRKALRLLDADHYMTDSRPLLAKVKTLRAIAELRRGKAKRAERVFRHMLKNDKENPFLKTRLAEALYQRKGDEAVEAWTILDDLEARDLIPDARGYAVLAFLRARANDQAGQQRARTRCLEMAGSETSICS